MLDKLLSKNRMKFRTAFAYAVLVAVLFNGCIQIMTDKSKIVKIEISNDPEYKYSVTVEAWVVNQVLKTNHEYKIGDKMLNCN